MLKSLLLIALFTATLPAATITSLEHSWGTPELGGELITIAGSAGTEVFVLPWASNGLWQWSANSHGQFVLQFGDTHADPPGDNFLMTGRYGAGNTGLDAAYDFTLSPDPSGIYTSVYLYMNGPVAGEPILIDDSGLVTFRYSLLGYGPDGRESTVTVDASFQLQNVNATQPAHTPEPGTWAAAGTGLAVIAGQRRFLSKRP